jgi:hypothetical protein
VTELGAFREIRACHDEPHLRLTETRTSEEFDNLMGIYIEKTHFPALKV